MSSTPTIGAPEVKAIQAEGWQLWSTGPECANGWPAIFRRGEESRVEILTNDLTRWPAAEPTSQPQPELFP
jgi:hypothetical protein